MNGHANLTRRPEYTEEEFVADYTRASGLSLEKLAEIHRAPRPCDCRYLHCRGWTMEYIEDEGASQEERTATRDGWR